MAVALPASDPIENGQVAMLKSASREEMRTPVRSTPTAPKDPSAFGDAVVAGLWRENTALSLWRELTDGDERRNLKEIADYNPYARLKEKYGPEVHAKLAKNISDGDFDQVYSDAQLDGTVNDLLSEYEDRAMAEQEPGAYFLGALVGGIFDPTSYIPMVGTGAKLTKLGKLGVFGLNAALSAGVSETVLQMTQRERTLDESLMSIGISGALGGGIGIFASALHPKSPLHPDNPVNPLRRENLGEMRQGEITRTIDGKVDELTPDELAEIEETVRAYSPQSAGAAKLGGPIPELARSEPKTPIGKAIRRGADWFNSKTIKGSVLRSASGAARYVGALLFDPAGMILKQNLSGIATAKPADTIKKWRMAEFQQVWNGMMSQVRQLNMEVKDAKRKIDAKDVFQVTQRRLYSDDDPELFQSLSNKYGEEAFEAIKAKADQFAETIHQFNARQEEELTSFGLIRDMAKTSQIEGEIASLRETIKAERAKGEAADKKLLETLRSDRERKLKELEVELAKPEPLGRDYGHAQMWNREVVMQNPAQFKAMLHDILALQPDALWLQSTRDMSLEEFAKLAPAEARPIREDWAGDAHHWKIEQLELQLESAKTREKSAALDLGEALRRFGLAKRDEGELSLSEARARRDKLHARIAANKATRQSIEKQQRTLIESATAARMTGADRAAREAAGEQTQLEITRDQRAARVDTSLEESIKAQRKADDLLLDAVTDPTTPVDEFGNSRAADAGDVAKAQLRADKAAEASDNSLGRLMDAEAKVRQDSDNVRVVTARQQGKAREAGVGMGDLIREAKELEVRAVELDNYLRDVEALKDAVTRTRRDLNEAVRVAKVERKIEATSVKKVKRALRAERGKPRLDEMVEDIYQSIASRGQTPHAILDRLLDESDRTTGRAKARQLHLSREQRLAATKAGFLRDDLSNILTAQADQVAAELSLREALDIGPGRRFESWKAVTDWVDTEYRDLIAEAPTPEAKNALTKESARVMQDLIEARDRLRGGNFHDDGTATGIINYGVRKLSQINLLRYGSGFLLSSQTDLATVALRHGSPAKLIMRYGKQVVDIMRRLHDEDPSHFLSFIRATELGQGAMATARRFGSENALHGQLWGYGIGIGTTRKVTAKVDQTLEALTQFGVKMGGMPLHNTFWKLTAAVAMRDKLAAMTARYSDLTPVQIADLASMGIGKQEADRIGRYVAEFGKKDADGVFDPRLEDWEGPDAADAARDFEMAIMRDMDRAVNTPDVGDTPRLMTHLAGQLLFTFQTFAFTFLNQYAYPMAQRIALFQDRQAMMSLGILLAAATGVMVGKDIINGRDPSNRFTEERFSETIYEIVDRSGLMGYMSPYVDSALKFTSGFTGFGGGDRYARNGYLESLLGVNFSLISDIQRSTAGMVAPEASLMDRLEKAAVIAPYKTQFQIFNRFLNPPQ